MPDTGWYPDPAGAPGRYRYWDGSRWSSFTTDDPRRPGPAKTPASGSTPSEPRNGEPPGQPSRGRRIGLIIGVLAVALLVAVASAIFVGNVRSVVDNPLPTSTAGGTEDSSPRGTPTSTQKHSATPTAVPQVPCPRGNPNQLARHPSDGRVYGGNLSFEAQPTFESAAVEPRFSFAYDVLQQTLPVSQNPPGSRSSPLASCAGRMASLVTRGTLWSAWCSAWSSATCTGHTCLCVQISAAKA